MQVKLEDFFGNKAHVLFMPESPDDQSAIHLLKEGRHLSSIAWQQIKACVTSALHYYGHAGFLGVKYEGYVDQCFVFTVSANDQPEDTRT